LRLHLRDGDLLAEIELYGELIIAASGSTGPLPVDQIDEILGLRPGGASPG
jgi:hypothetical protein